MLLCQLRTQSHRQLASIKQLKKPIIFLLKRQESSFSGFGLPDNLLGVLKSKYSHPTVIQEKCLPVALGGSNLVGIGKTGSGKTLAYALPAFVHILKTSPKHRKRRETYTGPKALVIAPTRELTVQVQEMCEEYQKVCKMKSLCCIGGESTSQQHADYKRLRPELILGTPGRLERLAESNKIKLGEVGFVVLDEADRMLSMGFESQIRFILSKVGGNAQVVMFSATWPKTVEELANEFLGSCSKIDLGDKNEAISQKVIMCAEVNRDFEFTELIKEMQNEKILVFTDRKANVDRLETILRRDCISALGLHGDKSFEDRQKILEMFRNGSCRLMIASDIAARGLDIPDVDVVVNYNFPRDQEHYIHRIGRTGRAGKSGRSFTLMSEEDSKHAEFLIQKLQEFNEHVPEKLFKLEEQGRLIWDPLGRVAREKQSMRMAQRSLKKFRINKSGKWEQPTPMKMRKKYGRPQEGFIYD